MYPWTWNIPKLADQTSNLSLTTESLMSCATKLGTWDILRLEVFLDRILAESLVDTDLNRC